MGDTSNVVQDFHNLDGSATSSHAFRFLDTLNASQQVQQMQALAHRMLELKPGARVLDAGCGVGDVARELAALVGPTGHVTGVDLSEAMVHEAAHRTRGLGLPVDFQQGDVHALGLPTHGFDACRASRVFIYLEDPRQALSELLRLTRPGGPVVLFEPELDSWVLDGPDRGVVRALVHFWADQLRNPWIARQLPALFMSLGVKQVSAVPVVGTWVLGMLETFGFHAVLDKAIAQGVVSQAQADAWVRFLKDAQREGSFYGSMSGMVVRGIKPGP
ncbi:methyltransferase domain-containing protein [Archangium primigenium]|uniref:methyltransferase domain-containing protein n=1 Tax=[Archangium] primigenium TaxID=2792470 RepID=UPI00195E0E51|nr:methyltransferase domain-containing protein [Archangium primigenium]MBM7114532.1 methyltransferase domain-containing protein [Archangium primigenium]